jgi:hypothetical protein
MSSTLIEKPIFNGLKLIQVISEQTFAFVYILFVLSLVTSSSRLFFSRIGDIIKFNYKNTIMRTIIYSVIL